jgi:hydrogenase nickel incorporation protein HypA/HybF
MHETSLFRSLLKQITSIAEENGADRVTAVRVRVGALANISADHFREHFDEAVQGSIVEGAALEVDMADDLGHDGAFQVVLESVDVNVPDRATG